MKRGARAATSPSSSPAPSSPPPEASSTSLPASRSSPRRRVPRPFRAMPRHPLTGRQITISAATQRELDSRLERIDRIRRDLHDGTITTADADRMLRRMTHGPITLERAAVAYARREGLAPETSRRVLSSWLAGAARELAALELETLDASTCKKWIDRLRGQGHAPSSIGTAWRTLSAVASYATVRGWIGAAPWGGWRPMIRGKRATREREAARSPEELARLLAAARELDALEAASGRRSALCNLEARIAVVGLLGARQGELAGLRWRDRDPPTLAERTITIARQWDGRRLPKGRRVVPLIPSGGAYLFALLDEVHARLERLDLVGPDGDGPMFPEPAAAAEGRRAHYACDKRSPDRVPLPSEELRAAVERAGLPRPEAWTATSLRDSFVSLEGAAYLARGDVAGLQERTRHASRSSLVRYFQSTSRGPAPPGFQLPPGPAPALPPASVSTSTSRNDKRRSKP